MIFNNRINGIVEMCNYSDIIIDMGCDHAYISINLIKKNKCKKCIAVDINESPLMNAKKNISKNCLNQSIKCVQSDGFDFINYVGNNTSSVIAGMGGNSISNILRKSMTKITKMDYILIQPTAYTKDVRKFLIDNKIHIEKENIIFSEGLYYEYILIFPKSQEFLNEEYQKFLLNFNYDMPICVFENINGKYNEYINYRIKKYERVLFEMGNSKLKDCEKFNVIDKNICILKGCLK